MIPQWHEDQKNAAFESQHRCRLPALSALRAFHDGRSTLKTVKTLASSAGVAVPAAGGNAEVKVLDINNKRKGRFDAQFWARGASDAL